MLQVTIDGLGKAACLPGLDEGRMRVLRHTAAVAVAALVKGNFHRLQPRSPHSNFWGDAMAMTSTVTPPDGKSETVAVYKRGVRLQLLGGVVRPTGKPSEVTGKPTTRLLIPFADSPLRLQDKTLHELHYPEENIHVIRSRNGCPILVAADPKDKQTNIIWLGKLVKQTVHKPHPEVLPTRQAMTEEAQEAVRVEIIKGMESRRQ